MKLSNFIILRVQFRLKFDFVYVAKSYNIFQKIITTN